ncbi:MAG: hypothetical protein R6V08_12080 [Desulfuromonadales bacterium]
MGILYFRVATQIVTSALLIFCAVPFASAQGMMGDKNIQTMDPADLPEPESEGAKLLEQFCTQMSWPVRTGSAYRR